MKKNIIEEQSYLNKTILRFNETLKEYDDSVKGFYKLYDDNPLLYSSLIESHKHKINSINKSLKKPYFARIDFEDSGEEMELYISKVGIFDVDNNPITIDWRAPVASIYYDSNLGDTSYVAPEGIVKGKLNLKRQYEINYNKLISFQDVDTVTNDELLKPYLSANNDNRLKNIVSTIQSEQNNIIRRSIYDNMIVQGVAGSGKTTVALHRIAYLEYNYREKYNSKDYLVIGPNKFFVNYISNVLPDLDVYDTPQITFEDLFKQLIKSKIKVKSNNENLQKAIKGESLEKERYKYSLELKKDIDIYVDNYLNNYIKNDLKIGNYVILSKNLIIKYFNELSEYEVFSDKIERLIVLLSTYIKNNMSRIINNVQEELFRSFDKDNYKKVQIALKKYCKKELRDYFNIKNINVVNLYKDLIKESTFEEEDYPGLMYFYYRIFGFHKYDNIKHTVIDEAQDYGLFNFYILKKLLPNSTFSIYGDLAQSLYSFHSINNWDELNLVFPNINICYLNKSYRTTFEILEYANKINKHLKLNEATPVIRHGNLVESRKFSKEDLIFKINEYKKKDYGEIAIVVKDDNELVEAEKLIRNIPGVKVITSYNVKGLEFDAVIIYNADNMVYDLNNTLDMKLLYVSLTRALHEMCVYYKNNLVEILK